MLLAPLMATLMQVAVSRRREALADVSAVEMTRYPPGLISALEKLRDDTTVTHSARGHGPPLDRAADVRASGDKGKFGAFNSCSTPTPRSRSASPPSASSEVPMTTAPPDAPRRGA